MLRELAEETSLDPVALSIKHTQDLSLHIPSLDETVAYHVYAAEVPDIHFEVYEGNGTEAYSRKEALARKDLTVSARHVLSN